MRGMAIFMISEGCTVVKPKLSQRRAPLRTSPPRATPTSSKTPTTYRGSAMRIKVWGEILAISHMTAKAIM